MTRPPTQYSQFTDDENALLRKVLREYLERAGLSVAAAAKQANVARQTFHAFLGETIGAGETIVRAIEALTGRARHELLGRPDLAPAGTRFRDQPGWDDAVALAKQLHRKDEKEWVPDHVYETIGGWSGDDPLPPEPRAIHRFAQVFWLTRTEETIAASLADEARRRLEARRAPADRAAPVAGSLEPTRSGEMPATARGSKARGVAG